MVWFFWQLRDYLPPARGWIRELVMRSDELDDLGRAELYVSAAVTASEVGDDDAARSALRHIEELGPRISDPSLLSGARLATLSLAVATGLGLGLRLWLKPGRRGARNVEWISASWTLIMYSWLGLAPWFGAR